MGYTTSFKGAFTLDAPAGKDPLVLKGKTKIETARNALVKIAELKYGGGRDSDDMATCGAPSPCGRRCSRPIAVTTTSARHRSLPCGVALSSARLKIRPRRLEEVERALRRPKPRTGPGNPRTLASPGLSTRPAGADRSYGFRQSPARLSPPGPTCSQLSPT